MTAEIDRRSDLDIARLSRTERVLSLSKPLPYLASAHVIAAILLSSLYGPSNHHVLLVSEPVILAMTYMLLLTRAHRIVPRSPSSQASISDEVFCAGGACFVGATCGLLPACLIPDAAPGQLLIIGGVDGALMAASTFASSCPFVALAFLCPVCVGVICGVSHRPEVPRGTISAGTALYAVILCFQIFYAYGSRKAAFRSQLALNEHREMVSLLLSEFEDGASDWLWETDIRGFLLRVPDRLTQVAGVDRKVLQNTSFLDLIDSGSRVPASAQDDFRQVLEAFRTSVPFHNVLLPMDFGGGKFWCRFSGKPRLLPDGSVIGFIGVGSDITATRAAAEHLEYLATHDELTGLPNRRAFLDAIEKACMAHGDFCVLYADLDRFKVVNDTYGHGVGDKVLEIAARRLTHATRPYDVVARVGGDEFALLLPGAGRVDGASVSARVISEIEAEMMVDGLPLLVGISIGVAVAAECLRNAAALTRAADLALYAAKETARGSARIFDAGLDMVARSNHQMILDIRAALHRDEFQLQFEPVRSAEDWALVAVEARTTWRHSSSHVVVADTKFSRLAEEAGISTEIGNWSFVEACSAIGQLPITVRLVFKVFPGQVQSENFVDNIRSALSNNGICPDRLELELSEIDFQKLEPSAKESLQELRQMGVALALGNFGSGLSSFKHLRSCPCDLLKIDCTFVDELANDDRFVAAIIEMASRLDMQTTADGVHTSGQLGRLQELGCNSVQGPLAGEPVCTSSLPSLFDFGRNVLPSVQTEVRHSEQTSTRLL